MARNQANVERNTFVKGLITEAGPLTFPENASKDELNFILNRDGSRQRRFGMDYESGFALVDTTLATNITDTTIINSCRWDNVNRDPNLSIGVVQVQSKLWFLDMSTASPSANLLNSGNPLTVSTISDGAFNFTSINGVLIIVGRGVDNPIYLSYNPTTDTVSQTTYNIEVRDIWGVDDGLAVDERPTTLSDEHNYNLLNQGWDATKISAFFSSQAAYPSNADIWTLGKDSSDNFDAALLVKQDFGTALAPKGRFIIEAFTRGVERTAASGVSNLPLDQEVGNVSTVATFAGRLFYAGVNGVVVSSDDNSPSYSSVLFFTQIVDNNIRLGQCFQEGDPTAEFNADLLPSDGGTISIPEASVITKVLAKEDGLLVFAENGVWVVRSSNGGFFADDIIVRRVTNVGAIGSDSIVDVDGTVVYWSKGGIYQLTPDQRTGRLIAQNITERTIQTKYNDIPFIGKVFAKGVFDTPGRKVKWLYNDTSSYNGIARVNNYNKELTLDLVLGAFSILDIKSVTSGPYVSGYISALDYISVTNQDVMVIDSDVVQIGTEDITYPVVVRQNTATNTKYVTIVPGATDSFTLGTFTNTNFLDWETFDSTGVDAAAYLVTGEEIFKDTQRVKGVTYITVHSRRTETGFVLDGNSELQAVNPSSCKVQARWDFTNDSSYGKFGNSFEAYRLKRNYIPSGTSDTFNYGQEVISTKTKLRGAGKALVLRFDTTAGKDMHLYGWALAADGNTVV